MLRAVARNATKLAPRYEAMVAQRSMSLGGMKGYDDREAAEERMYIKKEDERALRKLLAKMKAQADAGNPAVAEDSKNMEIAALKPIIAKYKISDADVEALIAWRHSADH